MTQEIADAIRDFTANGGTVIAESPFAFKDADNMFEGHAPICGLEKVFGVTMYDRKAGKPHRQWEYPAGKASCFFYWHVLEPVGELEAMVPYEDGRCAISCHRFGKGTAILAGTEIFRQYYESPAAPAVEWLRRRFLPPAWCAMPNCFGMGAVAMEPALKSVASSLIPRNSAFC